MLCASLDGRRVWGRMDVCMCMTELLYYTPEIIRTLLIGYTSLQNKMFKRKKKKKQKEVIQFSSVTQSCLILFNPINCSTPGLPVHHQLPEFTQTHIHRVTDAMQPSHSLSSPSPPAPNPSQHQSLFQ